MALQWHMLIRVHAFTPNIQRVDRSHRTLSARQKHSLSAGRTKTKKNTECQHVSWGMIPDGETGTCDSPPHRAPTQTRVPLVDLDAASYSLQRAIDVSLGGLLEDEGSAEDGANPSKTSDEQHTRFPSSGRLSQPKLKPVSRFGLSSYCTAPTAIDLTKPRIYKLPTTGDNASSPVDDEATDAIPDGWSAHHQGRPAA